MVDAGHQSKGDHGGFVVNSSLEGSVTRGIIPLGPFGFQQGLGASVAPLLFEVFADGIAPVVPNHGSGTKAESPSPLLESPADIHVIAGSIKLRVEPPHGFECRLPEGHVAPGNMLGHLIRYQDMGGAPGRMSHGIGHQRTLRRENIGAAYGRVTAVPE